ncbi:MAG: helix-turn-helix domain-containing protein, partial [Coriobacteriales bacterium]|nr:helix-turn-helix domain-containing protein [Coriobacteriales bacterium]
MAVWPRPATRATTQPPSGSRKVDASQVELSKHLEVPVQRINEIVNGKRGITPSTAWLLAEAFE